MPIKKPFYLIIALSILTGCGKNMTRQPTPSYRYQTPTPKPKPAPKETGKSLNTMSKEELLVEIDRIQQDGPAKKIPTNPLTKGLDFYAKNGTGKTIFVTCFSYVHTEKTKGWQWDKSPVLELKKGETALVDIDHIPKKREEKHVFGILGVFDSIDEANHATPELTDDRKTLDLDLLKNIKGETVIVTVEKYGFIQERLDFEIHDPSDQQSNQPELDFVVENQTGKTLYVTCFIYEHQQEAHDFLPWKYSKTSIKMIPDGKMSIIDVRTVKESYDWQYMRSNLAVFDEHSLDEAEKSTFELLPEINKLQLGRLANVVGKKIVLSVEQYGAEGDLIDFVVKPSSPKGR